MAKNSKEPSPPPPKDYLVHELSADYWHYIYTLSWVHTNNRMILQDVAELSSTIQSFRDVTTDEHKLILNALQQKRMTGNSCHDLSQYPHEILELFTAQYLICCEIGYYPWDINTAIDPHGLVQFLIEHSGATPSPACPFPSTREQTARAITLWIVNEVNFEGDFDRVLNFLKEFPMSRAGNPLEEGYDLKTDELCIRLEKLTRIITSLKLKTLQVDESTGQSFAKTRKDLAKIPFSPEGNLARAVGLLLWLESKSSEQSEAQVLAKFKKSEIYAVIDAAKIFKNSQNCFLSDKDDSVLLRWIKRTDECVMAKRVLGFS